MLGVTASEPASGGEAYGYKSGDFYVYVAGLVVGPYGEDADGKEQGREGGALGGELGHSVEVDEGGNEEGSSANADESGDDSDGETEGNCSNGGQGHRRFKCSGSGDGAPKDSVCRGYLHGYAWQVAAIYWIGEQDFLH